MKVKIITILLISFGWFNLAAAKDRVLVFSKTTGWHHESIKAGMAAIQKLGAENNFDVDTTSSADVFTTKGLKPYKVLIFLSPTGTNIFTDAQKQAFVAYIQHGGGFVGIHAAADCSYEWPWYNKLVGAYFKDHPKVQTATVQVVDAKHISTKHMPATFQHTDEWYNFKDMNPDVTVLLKVDESSYSGGENGDNHPVAWYHKYDGGRAFYTALGHTDECFTTDTLYLQHLLGGIKYAMGRR
ncbi:ThuA domain-containing protein [Mucilaginibacter conchicola]|uniref:ThuA domain-containing protein n=1 Tax=Mucilaginibacter conchicola TaxID=2303333 RepID=A0A372NV57_9SPHI|nr:ThuA domain-containing protein [Mucilaginibacter conchicola]RFZ93996.1 ThuA domain-containing protein [Mucilaginibacter conchicola]